MRIFLTADVTGGIWTYSCELAEALRARGHEVALGVLGSEPGAEQRGWLEAHPAVRATYLPCPLEWLPEPEPGLSGSVAPLREAVERFAADVVHLNQFFYGACELGAPKLVVAHSDVVGWWRAVKGRPPPDDAWFRRYGRWVREGLAGARARVAPSAWMAGQVEALWGAGPVRVIYNARSAGAFRSRRGVRREALVLAVGRLWDEAKGVRDLIPAAERLRERARVVVAGPVRHPGGGADFPTDAPEVHWAGELGWDALRLLLAQARVYAGTARYEPFGLAPLEAALAGCALVLSDIPTYRELWDGCAAFYPPGDGAALAEAAGELLADGERRRRLAVAGRSRARARFTPERQAADYEAVYSEIVRGARRTPPLQADAG